LGRNFKRIFFATDVHGSEICFRKFIGAADFYKADTLILGGDITGKLIVPIVERKDGRYTSKYLGQDWELKSQGELADFEQKIKITGFYPYRTNQSEMDELNADRSNVDQLFLRLMIETLKSWVVLAEKTLENKGVQCYITGGNDDPFEISQAIPNSGTVQNPEDRVVHLDEIHEMISLGYSNPTPWKLPRDVPEETLAQKIEEMTSRVQNMANCVFNLHVPPKDSNLDQCPLLDSSVDPPKTVMKSGQPVMYGAGSQAVTDAIKRYQPLLGLHGHIHESKASEKIGRTVCLNPGSEYSEGILRGVLVNYDQKKILSHQFTSG